MPGANCFRYASIANEHRIYRRSEESFDESGCASVGADEIAEGTEDGSFTEYPAVLEQARRRGSETNSLPFETLECIELRAQRSVEIFGTNEVFARRHLALARLLQRLTSGRRQLVRFGDVGRSYRRRVVSRSQRTTRCFGRVEKVDLFALE